MHLFRKKSLLSSLSFRSSAALRHRLAIRQDERVTNDERNTVRETMWSLRPLSFTLHPSPLTFTTPPAFPDSVPSAIFPEERSSRGWRCRPFAVARSCLRGRRARADFDPSPASWPSARPLPY